MRIGISARQKRLISATAVFALGAVAYFWLRPAHQQPVDPSVYPGLALLGAEEDGTIPSGYCGASRIDPNWLLTAAHCVDYRLGYAVFGRTKVSTEEDGQIVKVGPVCEHYLWQKGSNGSGPYDIALLGIEEQSSTDTSDDADFDRLKGTNLCDELAGGMDLVALGWGGSRYFRKLKRKPGLQLGCKSSCRKEKQFCTTGKQTIDMFDSGGPILAIVQGATFLVGVINTSSDRWQSGKHVDLTNDEVEGWIDAITSVKNPYADAELCKLCKGCKKGTE